MKLAGARRALGKLAGVLRLAVDVFEQRLELFGKRDVVVRAAQTPLAAKLAKRNAAVRADQVLELFGGRVTLFGRLVGGLGRFVLVLREVLLGAVLAQVKLLHGPRTDFRDVQCRRLGTAAAFLHGTWRLRIDSASLSRKRGLDKRG